MPAGITFLGHSTFQLSLPDERVIIVDPWLTENPACPDSFKNPSRCDFVFLTHGHFDHVGDVQALVDEAESLMGGVDVLINNAGLGGTKLLVDMEDDEWSRVLDVTLTGTMRMTRAMLRKMQPREAGVIVNNASVLGWRAQKEQCHYAAAKAGVMALTRCSALEAADYKVRINAVSPSIAFHEFLKKTTPMELLEELAAKEAFGRAAEVWEVANVMMFLASDYSSYMTGEIVPVSSQRA